MKHKVLLKGTQYSSITKPIVVSVSKDIMNFLNLDLERTDLTQGLNDVLRSSGSNRSDKDKSGQTDVLNVKITEKPLDEVVNTSIGDSKETGYLFEDVEAKASVFQTYRYQEYTLEYKYTSSSDVNVQDVVNIISEMIFSNNFSIKHNFNISYPIPKIVLNFMGSVYNNKSLVYPDLTINDYINEHVDRKKIDSFLSSKGSEHSAVSIKEIHGDVTGHFTGDLETKISEKEGIKSFVSFTYKFVMLKPLAFMLNHSILTYNKVLPKPFRTKDTTRPITGLTATDTYAGLKDIVTKHSSFGINNSGIYLKFPYYDTFKLEHAVYGYTPFMSILLQVPDEETKEILNISKLSTLTFIPSVYEMLVNQGDSVGIEMESLFYFTLVKNDYIDSKNPITIAPNGVVSSTEPLSRKNEYRLFMFICNKPSILSSKSKKDTLDFINEQIEVKKKEVREFENFQKESSKSGSREIRGKGIEVIKTEPVFLDAYIEFFKVPGDDINSAFKELSRVAPGDLLFKVKIPDFQWPKYSMYHNVDVKRIIRGVQDDV